MEHIKANCRFWAGIASKSVRTGPSRSKNGVASAGLCSTKSRKDVDARGKPGHGGLSTEILQHPLDHLTFFGGQGGLGRNGIADVVALDGQTSLDAGGQIVAREGL